MNGRPPNLILVVEVEVEEAFMHCPKAIVRSHLWQPDRWSGTADAPTLGEALVAHGRLPESVAQTEAIIENDGRTRLY